MVRIAGERVSTLFALAEREAGTGHPELADRYVRLARRIGMRYNVRLPPEYSELFCRRCLTFWIEGRNVRTRLRAGRRVRTCLSCGRERRVPFRTPRVASEARAGRPRRPSILEEGALLDASAEEDESPSEPPAREGP